MMLPELSKRNIECNKRFGIERALRGHVDLVSGEIAEDITIIMHILNKFHGHCFGSADQCHRNCCKRGRIYFAVDAGS